jgi:hemoglobin
MTDEQSLYDAIGGAPTISALVDRFYTNMELWPEARKSAPCMPPT